MVLGRLWYDIKGTYYFRFQNFLFFFLNWYIFSVLHGNFETTPDETKEGFTFQKNEMQIEYDSLF